MKCVYNDAGLCNLFTNEWANGICTNNEDCPYRKPLTNADKLRAMTDEQLAKYLFDRGNGSEYCYGICAHQDECAGSFREEFCIEQIVKWLKQEAQE